MTTKGSGTRFQATLFAIFFDIFLYNITQTEQISLPVCFLPGVDAGCFQHQYNDFGHTFLGVPKFNPYY